jgi:hypothetical protein
VPERERVGFEVRYDRSHDVERLENDQFGIYVVVRIGFVLRSRVGDIRGQDLLVINIPILRRQKEIGPFGL